MARLIEPVFLDDDGKIDWLATVDPEDVFYARVQRPTAFVNENDSTLFSLLSRKIVDLEQRIQELEANDRLRVECEESEDHL